MSRSFAGLAVLGLAFAALTCSPAPAQQPGNTNYTINRFYYYPYYYFPHSYWPQQGPQWPEQPGQPYQKPPAYMAYPAFREPHWRYELFEPQRYYRGFHFWLDQF
jgi:hypothetical protein